MTFAKGEANVNDKEWCKIEANFRPTLLQAPEKLSWNSSTSMILNVPSLPRTAEPALEVNFSHCSTRTKTANSATAGAKFKRASSMNHATQWKGQTSWSLN